MPKDWLLGLALCLAYGCTADSPTRGAHLERVSESSARAWRAHAPVRLAFTTDAPASPGSPPAKELAVYLVLTDEMVERVRGVVSSAVDAGLEPVAVQGTCSGDRLRLSPFEVELSPGTTLSMQTLSISAATASGSGAGFLATMIGDVGDQTSLDARVTVAAVGAGGSVAFRRPRNAADGPILLSDRIEVELDQPVPVSGLSTVRLLGNGTPMSGELRATSQVFGLATSAVFVPEGFLTPGATLTLDPAGLTNTAGRHVSWNGAGLTTAKDAGPLTVNASFEDGLRGWQTKGTVTVSDAFGGVAPAAGKAHAVIDLGSGLSGYLDVPSDATALSLSYAIFSEAGVFDANHSVVVTLTAEGGTRTVVVDGAADARYDVRGDFGPEFRHRIGPRTARVDLTRHRGRRIAFTADVRGSNYFGLNQFALVLDDIRVH